MCNRQITADRDPKLEAGPKLVLWPQLFEYDIFIDLDCKKMVLQCCHANETIP